MSATTELSGKDQIGLTDGRNVTATTADLCSREISYWAASGLSAKGSGMLSNVASNSNALRIQIIDLLDFTRASLVGATFSAYRSRIVNAPGSDTPAPMPCSDPYASEPRLMTDVAPINYPQYGNIGFRRA